jgi:hypothetical protein
MKHPSLLAVLVWSLLLLPLLCVTGVVAHPCPECPAEVECGHEADCAADPCVVETSGLELSGRWVSLWVPESLPRLPLSFAARVNSGGPQRPQGHLSKGWLRLGIAPASSTHDCPLLS